MEDALYVLPLLFDRVFIRGFHHFLNLRNRSTIISNLFTSKIAIPIVYGNEMSLYLASDEIMRELIFCSKLMGYAPMTNLITSLCYEDIRAMNDHTLHQFKERLRRFYGQGVDLDFYGCLKNELKKYNFDLLITARTGFPFAVEPMIGICVPHFGHSLSSVIL